MMKCIYSQSEHPANDDYFFEAVKATDYHFPNLKLHTHDFYEIFIVLSPGLQVQIEKNFYNISMGDIVIFPPHVSHNVCLQEENHELIYDRMYLWISEGCLRSFNFNKWDFCRTLRTAADTKKYVFRNIPYADFTRLVTSMSEIYNSKKATDDNRDLCNRVSVLTILTFLYIAIESSVAASSGGVTDPLIQKISKYIEKNCLNHFSIDDLTEQFNVNKNTLARRFKKATNMTVLDYKNFCKIKIAKEKMIEGMEPSEVCYESGFSDYSTFYRAFQKSEGISPREFLKTLG
jgi:AraC-like DNA-binding protein